MPLLHRPAMAAGISTSKDGALTTTITGTGFDGHCYRTNRTSNAAFSSWESIGSTLLTRPTLYCYADEPQYFLGLTRDNTCVCRTGDTDWSSLGGPKMKTAVAAITTGPITDDTDTGLHVFGVGMDNQCYHRTFKTVKPDEIKPDLPWTPLGGNFTSEITVIASHTNRLDIFAIGTNNQCYHACNIGYDFTPWESLGGSFISAIAAARLLGDRDQPTFAILGIGINNDLCYKEWDGANWRPERTAEWSSVLPKLILTSMPAIAVGPRCLDVFAINSDNKMVHATVALNSNREPLSWASEILDDSKQCSSAPTALQGRDTKGGKTDEVHVFVLNSSNTPMYMSRNRTDATGFGSATWNTSLAGAFISA